MWTSSFEPWFLWVQMSKAEKALQKKEKAKQFNTSAKKQAGKVAKNSKRWN